MLFAARSMAATLYDLYQSPGLLSRAMAEFRENEGKRRAL